MRLYFRYAKGLPYRTDIQRPVGLSPRGRDRGGHVGTIWYEGKSRWWALNSFTGEFFEARSEKEVRKKLENSVRNCLKAGEL